MADSSPEAEFGDVYDWKPPTQKKEEFKTSRETRLAERSSKRTTESSQRKSSGGASQTSRVPLVELLSPSEIRQRNETFENRRKISEQRLETFENFLDRTSKSTSSALRRKESSPFVSARKPSPSQRSSDATQLSSKQSVASSSANSKRDSVAHSSKSTFARKPSSSQQQALSFGSRTGRSRRQESSLTYASLKSSTFVERPTKVYKINAKSSASSKPEKDVSRPAYIWYYSCVLTNRSLTYSFACTQTESCTTTTQCRTGTFIYEYGYIPVIRW